MKVRLEQIVVTRSAWWRTLGFIAAGSAPLLALTAGAGFPQGTVLGIPVAFLVALFAWTNLFPMLRLEVRANDDGLRVGERSITSDDVEQVVIDPYPPLLRIELPGETLTLDVPQAEAQRIRAILTSEPRPPTARRTFTASSTALIGRARVAAASVVASGLAVGVAVALARWTTSVVGMLAGIAALVVGAVAARRLVTRTHVTIGGDGVLLRNGGSTRFVPRSEIAAFDAPGRLRVGEATIDLAASKRERPALRRAILGLIQGASDAPAELLEPVALGSSRPEQWIDALRRDRAEPSYRAASVDDDVRWRVAEDVAADPEQRAAAAIAVADTGEARERVRLIARNVAAPDLRALLDAVGTEDDAQLVEAVAALRRRG